MSDVEKNLKPEVIVFAGPNGSGKSTITKMAKTVGVRFTKNTSVFFFSYRKTGATMTRLLFV